MLAVLIDKDRKEDWIQVWIAIAVEVLEAAIVDLHALARDAGRQVAENAAFTFCFDVADPAIVIAVGDGQGLQAHLQPDHLDETAAKEVGGVTPRTAVLGDGHAGAAVAVRDVVAGAAGAGMAPIHHLAEAVGQGQAVEFPGLAVDAVALAKVALEHAAAPLITEPGIDLLQVHGAAAAGRVDGMHDANARVLDRQAAQVARHIDGMVARMTRSLGLLGPQRQQLT